MDKKILIVRTFLHNLLHAVFTKDAKPPWTKRAFKVGGLPGDNVRKLGRAWPNELFCALDAALGDDEQRNLSLILDGLEKVGEEQFEPFISVRKLVDSLQQRTSNFRALLTSRPLSEIHESFKGLPSIEFDRERQECLSSLHFDNTRFEKISEEHQGSCEWLWTHPQYKEWSASDYSRLLLIQGKPGSGKSTVTKYFNNKLLKWEPAAKTAIIARFFYSYREGSLQRSHYNMLRSVLYDILSQETSFFYHDLQGKYRAQRRHRALADWDYASLKDALGSLHDYHSAKRLYLIIDAVDESEETDRRSVLNLLIDLCSKSKFFTVKIFVATRPVSHLELRKNQFHNFIRLQDETKSDISSFAHSSLDGLNLPHVLAHVVEYIVESAQGVFLWVRLVTEELWDRVVKGTAEADIVDFLKSLPTDLEDLYKRMFDRLDTTIDDIKDRRKMFRLVLFACRPLTVDELLHSLAVRDDIKVPSEDLFRRRIPFEQCIVHYGGNFLEVREHNDNHVVQVMHQTVREFFLLSDGYVAETGFTMNDREAHTHISLICIQYLLLCTARASLPDTLLYQLDTWGPQHFITFAEYLNKWPLAIYALSYLNHHLSRCREDKIVQNLICCLLDQLTNHHENPFKALLEAWVKSSFNTQSCTHDWFKTAVFEAAFLNGLPTAAEWSIIAGAKADYRDKNMRTPLSKTAESGHEGVVRLLANRQDVVVDSEDKATRTPLSWAASSGQEKVVLLLLNRFEVKADGLDRNGRTPLSWAASNGQEKVVKLLADRPDVGTDRRDADGRTPLSWAASAGHEAVVMLLADRHDVDTESKDIYSRSPLSYAAENGHAGVVRFLAAQHEVDPDSKDKYKQTPLWWAAWSGHLEVVNLLVNLPNVSADSRDDQGRTPLLWAAEKGHEAVVRLLVNQRDVNADSSDENGRTPISWAAEYGNETIVQLLAGREDVNVDSRDTNGRTPLSFASGKGNTAIAMLLADHQQVNPDSRDRNGRTPISWAAENGREAVVKLLADHRDVDISSEDKRGWTPLRYAEVKSHEKVIRLLEGWRVASTRGKYNRQIHSRPGFVHDRKRWKG